MFSLIAAVGRNRELGKQGRLLFRLPEDMEFFKQTTMGHKVLMGRKTWESLPGKLPERENIVVSHHEVQGADKTVTDLAQFIEENKRAPEEIFVIGGGVIYQELLPYADKLYLTEVEADVPEADTWFPEFNLQEFNREVLKVGQKDELEYQFVKYERKEKR